MDKIGNEADVRSVSYGVQSLILDELCREQQLLCVEHIGSWVRFPDTLHEGYGHMAAIMGEN